MSYRAIIHNIFNSLFWVRYVTLLIKSNLIYVVLFHSCMHPNQLEWALHTHFQRRCNFAFVNSQKLFGHISLSD